MSLAALSKSKTNWAIHQQMHSILGGGGGGGMGVYSSRFILIRRLLFFYSFHTLVNNFSIMLGQCQSILVSISTQCVQGNNLTKAPFKTEDLLIQSPYL